MASLKQLGMILKIRQDAEDKAAQMMQQAQQALQQQEQQQVMIRQYKNDYLRKMSEHGQSGLSAQNYAQYQDFVIRLDDSIGRAEQQIAIAKQVFRQRQEAWKKSRADTQAIQTLIDKEQAALDLKAQRTEQKQLDEFVNARYARKG